MLAARVVGNTSLDRSDTRHRRVPWLVRHAGWLLDKYHVKGDKKTAFEDCFGKPYQGEVMKFAEAALFRVAVFPSGRIRDGSRQGRAARNSRMGLTKTAVSGPRGALDASITSARLHQTC